MALELRELRDDILGALSAPVLATDQQIASSVFGSLPGYYSTTRYLPLVLANDTTGVYEVVYVVSHAEGVNTVVVQRGKEGTEPLEWSIGDAIRVSPTVRDLGAPMVFSTATAVPNDLAIGARYIRAEEQVVRERTRWQGSQPTALAGVDDIGSSLTSFAAAAAGNKLRFMTRHAVMFTGAGGHIDYFWGGSNSFQQVALCIPYIICSGASAIAANGAVVVKTNLIAQPNGVSLRFMIADDEIYNNQSYVPLLNTQVHFGILVAGW